MPKYRWFANNIPGKIPARILQEGWQGNFRDYDLGAAGLAYVMSELSSENYGELRHTLAAELSKRCPFHEGRVSTYLPGDISESERLQFSTGGKVPVAANRIRQKSFPDGKPGWSVPVDSTAFHVAEIIAEFLAKTDNAFVIAEEGLGRSSDSWVKESGDPLLLFGEEIYYRFTKEMPGEMLQYLVDDVSPAYPTALLAMCSAANLDLAYPSGDITRTAIEQLADGVRAVFVGAYDAEGFVMWSRSED